MRTLITSALPFNTILSVENDTVKYRHYGVQPISRLYSPRIIDTLYPLKSHNLPPPHLSSPRPWQPPFRPLLLWVWLPEILHLSGIIQYLSIYDWLIPLSRLSSRVMLTRPQMTSFTESVTWWNQTKRTVLLSTSCVKGNRSKAKARDEFSDESCRSREPSWNKGLTRGLLWC